MENKVYTNTEVKSSNTEDRIIEFTATEQLPDYDNDIIMVEGIDISHIKKNKSFLWSHQQSAPPIGKIVSLKKDGKKLIGKAQLTSEEEYPFGYQIYKLIKNGYINNVSISFVPDYKDIEYKEKDGKQVRIINKSTLLEVSAVNIGANNRAVITAAKSLKDTFEKAWDDGVLDGTDLNVLNDTIDKMLDTTTKQIEIEDKDNKIKELTNKVLQLEAEVQVLSKEEDTEEETVLSYIFKDYQARSTQKVADAEQIDKAEDYFIKK
jgi:HK97 family phage prohead protease